MSIFIADRIMKLFHPKLINQPHSPDVFGFRGLIRRSAESCAQVPQGTTRLAAVPIIDLFAYP